jgi:hypothetical protein
MRKKCKKHMSYPFEIGRFYPSSLDLGEVDLPFMPPSPSMGILVFQFSLPLAFAHIQNQDLSLQLQK